MKMIAKTALISATLFGGYYYGNKLAGDEVPFPERELLVCRQKSVSSAKTNLHIPFMLRNV